MRQPLFEQRCERPLKQIADKNIELFEHILCVFGGKPAETGVDTDIAFVLHLLPKVPMLISYSRPEEGCESKFGIFFDAMAEDNLNIESIHMLCSGFVTMFEKITARHG